MKSLSSSNTLFGITYALSIGLIVLLNRGFELKFPGILQKQIKVLISIDRTTHILIKIKKIIPSDHCVKVWLEPFAHELLHHLLY